MGDNSWAGGAECTGVVSGMLISLAAMSELYGANYTCLLQFQIWTGITPIYSDARAAVMGDEAE